METLEVSKVSKTFILNTDAKSREFKSRDVLPSDKRVVSKIDGSIQHLNYLEYLEICWANHYSIVLKPDYLWHIMLCEIAVHIKENPEKYRHLFTDSQTKKEISVESASAHILPLERIVEKLKSNIPIDVEEFLPNFSTTNLMSTLAFNAAFCDAMSPYYNYSMYLCAFPKIRIDGEINDWKKMIASISVIRKYFELSEYFTEIEKCINNIIDALNRDDKTYFESMFKLERCGSGSQYTVDGWIKKFFVKAVRFGLTNNYPSCISQVDYKNLSLNKDFFMKVGLLSSSFEDDFLIPEYGFNVYEK